MRDCYGILVDGDQLVLPVRPQVETQGAIAAEICDCDASVSGGTI
ncbi:MAG: hypothetical protein AAFX78_09770 [Cyanobacteria bacterium J06638_20]